MYYHNMALVFVFMPYHPNPAEEVGKTLSGSQCSVCTDKMGQTAE